MMELSSETFLRYWESYLSSFCCWEDDKSLAGLDSGLALDELVYGLPMRTVSSSSSSPRVNG